MGYIVGYIVVAIFSLVLCAEYASIKAGVFFLLMFLMLPLARFKIEKQWFKGVTWIISSLMIIIVITQLMSDGVHIWKLGEIQILLTISLHLILPLILLGITSNIGFSVIIGSMPFLIIAFLNHYVYKFRGTAFLISDLNAYKTAMNVVGEYKITLPTIHLYCLILLSFVCLSYTSISKEYRKRKFSAKVRVSLGGAGVLLLILTLHGICQNIDIETWGNDGARFNGYIVNFCAQAMNLLTSKKPEGYSESSIDELEKKYYFEEQIYADDILPTIIAIMDESFSDFSEWEEYLDDNSKILPNWKSYEENVIKGYATASVFGGGTANSEYEFLTGNTMAFLTPGATVYQLYLNDNSYSLPSFLSCMGYTCIASHPYYSSGWSRTKAWQYLGFDQQMFIEDFSQDNLVRSFVSDQGDFENIISQYEEYREEGPLFLFNVTMQNHGSYDDEDYIPDIHLNKAYSGAEYDELEQYIDLTNKTDLALTELFEYFERVEDDVVILIFGDHQPKLADSVYEKMYDSSFETIDEKQLKYKVPFLVWTNYNIENQFVEQTSLNYLSSYLLKAANIEMSPYNSFLDDVEKIIPAINANGYYSKSKQKWLTVDEAEGLEQETLLQYQYLQYNSIFAKDQSSFFFSNYIKDGKEN